MAQKTLLVILFLCISPSAWPRGGPPQLMRASEATSVCKNVTGLGTAVKNESPSAPME
jgi:hypothetical protein